MPSVMQTVTSAPWNNPPLRFAMSIHRLLRVCIFLVAIGLVVGIGCPQAARGVTSVTSFRQVNPDELKMTSESAAPGAPAIILYREVYRDDSSQTGHEDNYY